MAHVQTCHKHAWLHTLLQLLRLLFPGADALRALGASICERVDLRLRVRRALEKVCLSTFTYAWGLVFNKGPPFKRVFKILTGNTFTIARAKNTTLKALTVLLQTPRLLARAPLHVLLIWRNFWFFKCSGSHRLNDLIGLSSDFGSKRGRCAFKRLLHSFMSVDFMRQVVVARVAVTPAGNAVKPACETLAVELETLAVAAIASLVVLVRHLKTLLVQT